MLQKGKSVPVVMQNSISHAAKVNPKLHGDALFHLEAPLQGTPEYSQSHRGRDSACQRPEREVESDTHLDSRKVNEAAERRFKAASWLQNMVGPLHLSAEPSEDELHSCLRNGLVLCNLINKVFPGAVPKIVENTALASRPEGAAFQYFENIRNFLVAVEAMKLPSFDVSDLERGCLKAGSSAKVVDCILSIKVYNDWQKSGGRGFLGPCPPKEATRPHLASSWLGTGRTSESLPCSMTKEDGMTEKAGLSSSANSVEEFQKAWAYSDSSVAWVEHVCKKFVDTFMARSNNSFQASGLRIPATNMPCEALLKLVMAVLDDRNPEEVVMLVEFMLKKVIEEFGQRPLHSKGKDFSQDSQNCSEQYTNLQQDIGNCKGLDRHYALKLESQNKELKDLKCSLETTRRQVMNLQAGWEKEMEALNGKLHGLAQAAAEYHKVAAENRELYNQIQDLKGNIRVYCRVRPFLSGQNSNASTVDFIGDRGSIVVVNPSKQGKEQRKAFTFNKVFGPSASQEKVFIDTQPLIRSVLDGYNVCIFAYGQTGSGKTYTMAGPNNPSQEDWGVNFRALHDLFEICELRKNVMRYDVGVQMIEIYNEQVRDLLCMDGANKKLEIRNNSQQNGLNVPDAKLLSVTSTEDVLELMVMGQRNRAVGATALNERSSRSHSVLTVHVRGIDLASGCVLHGCLHLVDLAGSERVDKSEATGDRLKEAQHINKSLSALGDVIAALAQKSPHVPYRNSKLTQLLQDSLGGQAKTLMFVHISPERDSYGETVTTLKFAERVATVELGAAHANKETYDVKDLKNQIAFLKDALAKKDMALELFQKECRMRGFEISHDRMRAKISSNDVSTVTGHGNGRSPLGGIPNLEVRESPGVAERPVQITDPQNQHPFPLMNYSGTLTSSYPYEVEDDSLKRRAFEATSPDSRSSSGTTVMVSSLLSTARIDSKNSSKKNKIRHGSFDEVDSILPRSLYGYDDLDESSEVDNRPSVKQGGIKEQSKLSMSSHHHIPITRSLSVTDFRVSPMTDTQSTAAPIHVAVDSGDSYYTEDDETISDYSEADSWQMAGVDLDMSVASFGKRRKEGDRRFMGQQQPGHLAKKPITTVQATMASPKKHGLAGMTAESNRMEGKPTPEPKLLASKKPI